MNASLMNFYRSIYRHIQVSNDAAKLRRKIVENLAQSGCLPVGRQRGPLATSKRLDCWQGQIDQLWQVSLVNNGC